MLTKKTAVIMAGFIFLIAIASANFASAATEWTPLVRIPGLPSTGTVNLSMYLIGLYNFLLSIVGIVAVIMLIIGGMRYITAVGNPTAISDAKDIIYSAITGLLLALLSWVFISTINPDVLFIKQPGSAGVTDPTTGVKDLGAFPPSTSPSPCIKSGSPVDRNSLNFNKNPYNGKCQCVDQAFVPLSAATCQETCAPKNCLVADFRIGLINADDAQAWAIVSEYEIAKTYAIYNPSFTGPLEYNVSDPNTCDVAIAVNAIDYTKAPNGVIPTFTIDLNAAGGPGNIITGGRGPYGTPLNGTGYFAIRGCLLPTYNMLLAETECKKEFWSSGLLCPITVAADFGGTIKESTKYIKLFKP